MMRISRLPTRGMPDGMSEADKATLRRADMENMISALKGVSSGALSEAVERIMQNALGHKWMPLPPELRGLCDQIMKPINEARAWDARDRKVREEMEEDRKRASDREMRDEAFYERGRKRMEDFHAIMKTEDEKAQENTYDAAMTRLQTLAESNGKEFSADSFTGASNGTFKQIGRLAA